MHSKQHYLDKNSFTCMSQQITPEYKVLAQECPAR